MLRLLTRAFSVRRVGLILVEHALIVLSVIVAAIIRLGLPDPPLSVFAEWAGRAVLVAAVLQ
ncbi:MAG TPA: hypothetical protein VL263_11285, partial [Vicinamibacterales bacterium]|nr:hypothetical protein [Vicinamibacterales bacterium]